MKCRVLVVEDSPTARALLCGILAADPDVEIVGEARNGVQAVELTKILKPHVITMDIEMPVMDGYEATRRIMSEAPTPIVVVSGSASADEIAASMRSLSAGALTLIQKPWGPGSPHFEEMCRHLVTTVKSLAEVKVVRRRELPRERERPAPKPKGRPRVVAIAASTGGPAALHRIVSSLPPDFPAPVLVVQHLAAGFSDGLVTWLNGASPLAVKTATDGESLAPATVYVAAEGRHLGATSLGRALVVASPPIEGYRPSASFLFESVARAYGSGAVGIILTGMGRDGVEGLRHVRQQGGFVIAQDAATSVVFGMPGAAIEGGLTDAVLGLDAIAGHTQALFTYGKPDRHRGDN